MSSSSSPSSLGLSLLSWKAPKTLAATLAALPSEFLDLFEDKVIYFQEISSKDRELAEQYGFRYEGNDANVGIREGIKQAVLANQCEQVLFLENDVCFNQELDSAITQLKTAHQALVDGIVPVVRLRHRQEPGQAYPAIAKYKNYWGDAATQNSTKLKLKRLLRPTKARKLIGQAVMVLDHPEQHFDARDIQLQEQNYYTVNTAVLPWTNQSILLQKEWFLNTLIPIAEASKTKRHVNGFPDLEKELNSAWWRQQTFRMGVSNPGIFTHHRLDR